LPSPTTDPRPADLPPADLPAAGAAPARRSRFRRWQRAWSVVAGLVVLGAFVVPDDLGQARVGALVRLPVEVLVAVGLVLVVPARARRPVAAAAGALLGLLAVLKVVDLGFSATQGRSFDLLLDWPLLGSATGIVEDSAGRLGAIGAVVGAGLLVAGLVAATTAAAVRLATAASAHRGTTVKAVAALSAVAAIAAVAGVPVAAHTGAAVAYGKAEAIRAGLHDRAEFAAKLADDPYRDVPTLLTALRGKDVLITFVESYGRAAIDDPRIAPPVTQVLDQGTRELDAAGYHSRSAYLTSSVVGGGSWLAHATLLSGVEVGTQQRYRTLTTSDRLTLPVAFARSGWRTVSVEPAVDAPWPEADFYGYAGRLDGTNLGYRGPRFSYSPMPDQYALSAFQREERSKPTPVLGEITLTSSHSPWTPVPKLVPWESVGDGSIFADAANSTGGPGSSVLGSADRLRVAYRESVAYSLRTLISYVRTYGDKDLVLVFLGDHQPAPIVTGAGAGRDVPITIVTSDRAVLDRVDGWGWDEGLRPGDTAPVWPMAAFRNRFLATFGPATH
jgi:hypothetical protein